jgi:hypothetical protein
MVQQAERTEGPKVIELLGQAVPAYQSALKVFTREAFPVYHEPKLGERSETPGTDKSQRTMSCEASK